MELAQTRGMLEQRYEEIKNGTVKPVNGEEAFRRIQTKSEERRRS